LIIPKGDSILDIGSGRGWYVLALRDLGYNVDGVDGADGIEEISRSLVRKCDLTVMGALQSLSYDWGVFISVGEHIPKQFESVVIDNVSTVSRKGLIVAWGPPNQPGRGHVNCQPLSYIRDQFMQREFYVDAEAISLLNSCLVKRKSKGRFLVLRRGVLNG
jgi:2-polyprenyl-3-methyl-5-hydroxy-6-metoxy-1,4-benzoquinol methylase